MIKRLAVSVPMLALASLILLISILRTAAVRYEFTGTVNGSNKNGDGETFVDYYLAFPGKVLPDNPLWSVKATRDQIWLATTTDQARKAELYLLFADKRLATSRIFFEQGNPEEGYSSLVKAEQYLYESSELLQSNVDAGIDVSTFPRTLALASLKHRQIIEEVIMPLAPDDAKPSIMQTLDTAKNVYEKSTHILNQRGMDVPKNPFDS